MTKENNHSGRSSAKTSFHIGMRNVKTGLSVFLCLLFYYKIGRDGYFLACTSAIICMQDSLEKSFASGINRLIGTAFGALLGMLLLYLNLYAPVDLTLYTATIGTILFILLCNLIHKPDAIVIGCVVLLLIVLQQTDQSPFLYSVDRLIDTFVGIFVALLVNRFIRTPHPHDPSEDSPDLPVQESGPEAAPAPSPGMFDSQNQQGSIKRKKGLSNMYSEIMDTIGFVEKVDPDVGAAMRSELGRQRRNLELIASENLVSPAVMAAAGSVLTNKYAEGYPGKRYYGGCQDVDVVENIAIERAKKLFGANYANVQPHSGAQANEAVYQALLNHGDTVLGMDLAQGGHLTHGSPVNFSGLNYNIVPYGVDSVTHRIDYDEVRRLAMEHKPKMIIAGASAYPREIDFARFAEIAKECGAYLFVDMAHIAGLVAAGQHMSPIPHAHVVTTTTHKTLRGIRGGAIFTNDEMLAGKINKAVFPGTQGGPLMHVIAAKAVGFGEALRDEFKQYQKQVVLNSKALADDLLAKGFDLVSGGTDNHLMLVDLTKMDITGKDLEHKLDEVYITVNKNSVPGEKRSPFVTSGIRIGTAAVTTRGLKEADMEVIADCIHKAATDFEGQADAIRAAVNGLCAKYPLYE